ncbi:hypothetical protein FOA52_001381 [Chlamydomonas sp. UWO 241]|nr:hypothetical protein FOA52_001381 [Chlamydomonas sp. UWO 241]
MQGATFSMRARPADCCSAAAGPASARMHGAPFPMRARQLRCSAAAGPQEPTAAFLPGTHGRAKAVDNGVPRLDQEADFRYRRADMSQLHAYTARWRFGRNIVRGEAGMNLAEAALLVAAEDDAIASHSTVAFPVEAFLGRIQTLADEFEQQRLWPMAEETARAGSVWAVQPAAQLCARPPGRVVGVVTGRGRVRGDSGGGGGGGGTSVGGGGGGGGGGGRARGALDPCSVLSALNDFLFVGQRISAAPFGRSNLPPNSVLDHPGVWEDARWGYLNETLIRRRGHPAAVAILYAEVMRRLLSKGAVDFAVAIDTAGFSGLPRPVVLKGFSRDMLMRGPPAQSLSASRGESEGVSSGEPPLMALNTCTSDALAELLRHLKRSYWPLPWDTSVDACVDGGSGSHGGFRPAAKAATGDSMGAQLRAVSQVANWRLERGIWTSPGAGDIRRCRAACERLVLLGGEGAEAERRDLAVILLHQGELSRAAAELDAYMGSAHYKSAADPMDRTLCRTMAGLLGGVESLERAVPVSLEVLLAGPTPEEARFDEAKMPLTW